MLPPACPLCIVNLGANSSTNKQHTNSCPYDVKEKLIHHTKQPTYITPWFSSDAHVAIVGPFGSYSYTAPV